MENKKHSKEVCPNCGYCPTCGRHRDASPFIPSYPIWIAPQYWRPWYTDGVGPVWTVGDTVTVPTVTSPGPSASGTVTFGWS